MRDFSVEIVCPRCHWKCARRSRRRRNLDLVAVLLFLRPYRCRSCRARFYRLPVWSLEHHQTAPDGLRNRLGAAGGAELGEDGSDVGLDGVLGDVESVSD
jgi:hypothetical protein